MYERKAGGEGLNGNKNARMDPKVPKYLHEKINRHFELVELIINFLVQQSSWMELACFFSFSLLELRTGLFHKLCAFSNHLFSTLKGSVRAYVNKLALLHKFCAFLNNLFSVQGQSIRRPQLIWD